MAGAPGSGKTSTLKRLGLGDYESVNVDKFYEKALCPKTGGPGLNTRRIKNDYLDARDKLWNEIKNVLGIEKSEERYKHKDLMGFYEEAIAAEPGNQKLLAAKANYDPKFSDMQSVGSLFAKSQKQARKQQACLANEEVSFIIDGTGGNFHDYRSKNKQLEEQGYKTAMIFVDVPLDTAIERRRGPLEPEEQPEAEEKRTLPSGAVKRSWTAVNKNKEKYEELFGDNFFQIISTDEDFDRTIEEVQPRINAFLKQVNEDFQQDVKKQHKKMKIRLIGLGGNKKKEDPYVKNPSMKRSKSAPHGFGGS